MATYISNDFNPVIHLRRHAYTMANTPEGYFQQSNKVDNMMLVFIITLTP